MKKKRKYRKPKLVKGDLEYIKSLTQKTKRPQLDNFAIEESILHSTFRLYEDRIKAPPLYVPTREYIQKDESTPLPPENLQLTTKYLSQRAALAWTLWTDQNQDSVIIEGQEYKTLKGNIQELFFEKSEIDSYNYLKDEVSKIDEEWVDEESNKIIRLLSETPKLLNTKPAVLKKDTYNRTFSDYLENLNFSDYQTNIWRKNSLNDLDHLLATSGFRDDPDYIPPISGSRNFNLGPPARRKFNTIFHVYLTEKQYEVVQPKIDEKITKDYNTQTDIQYLYNLKNIKPFKIVEIYTRYEIDLRVTYAADPDPVNYKKLDPNSDLGMKILNVYNDQHHIWKEHCWEGTHDDGSTTKKVVYSLTINKNDNKVTFWVYLDQAYVRTGNSVVYNRKPLPSISYKNYKNSEGKLIPIVANITFSRQNEFIKASSGYLEQNKTANKYVINNLKNKLKAEGYTFVRETEDIFGLVSQLYLRNDALTRKDREKLLMSKADWEKKYIPS